jgi:peptidoglycan/xylan/chitin deacetylase (PgdA/CDA1 family)
MKPIRLAAAGAVAWAAWGWGAQLALPLLAVRRGRPGSRQVALTFDDGPDPEATPRVLDRLAARGVRATFFLIGQRAVRHPELVRALVAAGHEVGTHTWAHRNAWFLGPAATADELRRGVGALADITGAPPRLYRPPWGIVNLAALRVAAAAGLTTVLWSMQPEGLRPRTPAEQLRYCARRLHDGAILDLHDAPGLPGAPQRLLGFLPDLLDLLADRGLAPVPVGSLSGVSPSAPARPKNLGHLPPAG